MAYKRAVPGVNQAVQLLEELDYRMKNDEFGFKLHDNANINLIIDALYQLERARKSTHEDLERESIHLNILRNHVDLLPQRIKAEQDELTRIAREQNKNKMAELRAQMKMNEAEIISVNAESEVIEANNKHLLAERDTLREEYNAITIHLNKELAEKCNMAIRLNNTVEEIRNTRENLLNKEDYIMRIQEEIVDERLEALNIKRQLKAQIQNQSRQIKQQNKMNDEKQAELTFKTEKLRQSEKALDATVSRLSIMDDQRIRNEETVTDLTADLARIKGKVVQLTLEGAGKMSKEDIEKKYFKDTIDVFQTKFTKVKEDYANDLTKRRTEKEHKKQMEGVLGSELKQQERRNKEISEHLNTLALRRSELEQKIHEVGHTKKLNQKLASYKSVIRRTHRSNMKELQYDVDEEERTLETEVEQLTYEQDMCEHITEKLEKLKTASLLIVEDLEAYVEQQQIHLAELQEKGSDMQKDLTVEVDAIDEIMEEVETAECALVTAQSFFVEREEIMQQEIDRLRERGHEISRDIELAKARMEEAKLALLHFEMPVPTPPKKKKGSTEGSSKDGSEESLTSSSASSSTQSDFDLGEYLLSKYARPFKRTTDGSILANEGWRIATDGTKIAEDGTRIAVDGTITTEDGTTIAVDGTITAEDGTILAEAGSRIAEDGMIIAPDGSRRTLLAVRKDGSTLNLGLAARTASEKSFDIQLSKSIDTLDDFLHMSKQQKGDLKDWLADGGLYFDALKDVMLTKEEKVIMKELETQHAQTKQTIEHLAPAFSQQELFYKTRVEEHLTQIKEIKDLKERKEALEPAIEEVRKTLEKETAPELNGLTPVQNIRLKVQQHQQAGLLNYARNFKIICEKELDVTNGACRLRLLVEENDKLQQAGDYVAALVADMKLQLETWEIANSLRERRVTYLVDVVKRLHVRDAELYETFFLEDTIYLNRYGKLVDWLVKRQDVIEVVAGNLKTELVELAGIAAKLSTPFRKPPAKLTRKQLRLVQAGDIMDNGLVRSIRKQIPKIRRRTKSILLPERPKPMRRSCIRLPSLSDVDRKTTETDSGRRRSLTPSEGERRVSLALSDGERRKSQASLDGERRETQAPSAPWRKKSMSPAESIGERRKSLAPDREKKESQASFESDRERKKSEPTSDTERKKSQASESDKERKKSLAPSDGERKKSQTFSVSDGERKKSQDTHEGERKSSHDPSVREIKKAQFTVDENGEEMSEEERRKSLFSTYRERRKSLVAEMERRRTLFAGRERRKSLALLSSKESCSQVEETSYHDLAFSKRGWVTESYRDMRRKTVVASESLQDLIQKKASSQQGRRKTVCISPTARDTSERTAEEHDRERVHFSDSDGEMMTDRARKKTMFSTDSDGEAQKTEYVSDSDLPTVILTPSEVFSPTELNMMGKTPRKSSLSASASEGKRRVSMDPSLDEGAEDEEYRKYASVELNNVSTPVWRETREHRSSFTILPQSKKKQVNFFQQYWADKEEPMPSRVPKPPPMKIAPWRLTPTERVDGTSTQVWQKHKQTKSSVFSPEYELHLAYRKIIKQVYKDSGILMTSMKTPGTLRKVLTRLDFDDVVHFHPPSSHPPASR